MRKNSLPAVLGAAAGALIVAAFIFARASRPGPRAEERTGPVVRISISRTGAIAVDGNPSSLVQLEPLLVRLKAEDGTVWYYRERGDGKPPAEVVQVMKLVIDHRVPISLSSLPDFSNYLDEKGGSHPRKP